MKKLLATLAFLLVATAASARILVVVEQLDPKDSGGTETAVANNTFRLMQNRLTAACVDVFNRTGMTYDIVPTTAMRTRWLKDGKLVKNWTGFNGDSSYVQYDGVIILNAIVRPLGGVTLQRPWPPSQTGCYACSLTTNPAFYPRVPIISIFGGNNAISLHSTGYSWIGKAGSGVSTCSTGVAVASGAGTGMPVLSYATTLRSRLWFSASNKYAGPLSGSTGYLKITASVAGGVRALLAKHDPLSRFYVSTSYSGVRPMLDPLDQAADAGSDTVDVWERLFTGFAGTVYGGANIPSNVRMIYANVMGASPCVDSLSFAGPQDQNVPCEFDAPTLLYCLAHLDSLTGGKVWEASTSKIPLKAAITIDGAFTRNKRTWSLGFADADSTVIKASLDSLAALGVPVTVGVNVDSIAAYPYEVAWWNKLRGARFSPQAWSGVDRFLQRTNNQPPAVDTSTQVYPVAGSGNWTLAFPVDIFGRYRARAFYGDSASLHTVDGADSSIYQGLLAAKAIVKTYWPDRVSGLLMAARDDYSPYRYFPQTSWIDSLTYVIRKAGFIALRTDVQYRDADPSRWKLALSEVRLLRGGMGSQRYVPNNFGGGDALRLLGVNGYQNTGASYQYTLAAGTNIDTTAALTEFYGQSSASSPPVPTMYMSRFYSGFLYDKFVDPDYFQQGYGFKDNNATNMIGGAWFPMEDHFSPSGHGSIFKITATELSGDPAGVASRPGYWAIKSLANSFAAINAAAGRNVCVLGYPEDIVP